MPYRIIAAVVIIICGLIALLPVLLAIDAVSGLWGPSANSGVILLMLGLFGLMVVAALFAGAVHIIRG